MQLQTGNLVFGRSKIPTKPFNSSLQFMFHQLSNFKSYSWDKEKARFSLKAVLPGQFDVAKYIGRYCCC